MPKLIPLPPLEVLRDLFTYDPLTGSLYKRGRLIDSRGGKYIKVRVGKKVYQTSRIIWMLLTGNDPGERYVDHISGDQFDQRPGNLRLAKPAQNIQNSKRMSTNKTGYKGVCYRKKRGYIAQIMANGARYVFGPFRDPKDAYMAYCKAAIELHGQFARFE